MKKFTVAFLAAVLFCGVAQAAEKKFVEAVKEQLVRVDGKTLKKVEAKGLEGAKYIAVYYSASWCGPCRKFTPSLVKFYNEIKPKHPEFELIFVSHDNSSQEMQKYMIDDQMPWPAVRYMSGKSKAAEQYAGPGIPCLVLLDASGNVLSDSYVNRQYVGPNKVLADIQKTLSGS